MARDNRGRFVKGNVPHHAGKYNYTNCKFCDKQIRTMKSRESKFCGHSCAMKFRFKHIHQNNPRMKEEYLVVTKKGKAKLLHRMIYEKEIGQIPQGFVVHHVNGDKLDNRPENLVAMSNSEHSKHHHKIRRSE